MMALIVEDGHGLSNAQSYCSVDYANAYHNTHYHIAWDAVTDKEAALINATDYINKHCKDLWTGLRRTKSQTLDWPRLWVPKKNTPHNVIVYYANNKIPIELVNACADLSLRLIADDVLDQDIPSIINGILEPYLCSNGYDGDRP